MKQEIETTFDEEILFSDLWALILSNSKLILFTTLITTILAIANALITPPMFRASAIITKSEVKSGQNRSASMLSGFEGIAGIAGIKIPSASSDLSIAILKSNNFKKEFIKENNLLQVLFADDWDSNKKSWKDEAPTYYSAVRLFNTVVNIVSDGEGLINITVEWSDPILVANWANQMVVSINSRLRNDAITEAQKSLEFLEKEISKTANMRIQNILSSLMQEQKENMMLANVREEYAFKVIDPAVIPEEKSGPNRRGMVLLGLIAGLFLSIFYIFLRSYLISTKPA